MYITRPYEYHEIETVRLAGAIVFRAVVYRAGKVVACRTCDSYESAVYFATH